MNSPAPVEPSQKKDVCTGFLLYRYTRIPVISQVSSYNKGRGSRMYSRDLRRVRAVYSSILGDRGGPQREVYERGA